MHVWMLVLLSGWFCRLHGTWGSGRLVRPRLVLRQTMWSVEPWHYSVSKLIFIRTHFNFFSGQILFQCDYIKLWFPVFNCILGIVGLCIDDNDDDLLLYYKLWMVTTFTKTKNYYYIYYLSICVSATLSYCNLQCVYSWNSHKYFDSIEIVWKYLPTV